MKIDDNKKSGIRLMVTSVLAAFALFLVAGCASSSTLNTAGDPYAAYPHVPKGYFDEAEVIPQFWLTTVDEVNYFLDNKIKKGTVEVIGVSAGGRPIRAVFYGTARSDDGTTTFSGAVGSYDPTVADYLGSDLDKTVFVGLAGVHGFELETIVGALSLLSVLETGVDLAGNPQPEILAGAEGVDRIVVIPLLNPDGRARVPVRMEAFRGTDSDSYIVHEYLNTGGNKDGGIIGWPTVKKFIPMDFDQFGFAGGYPNDAGVNLMHDDFMGSPQPETIALLSLMARERPDLILNMHTGVAKKNYFMHIHRPFTEPALSPVFDAFYTDLKTHLTEKGLQGTRDVAYESDPSRVKTEPYNLNTALNLNSGALSIVIESPSHGYGGTDPQGNDAIHTAEDLLNMQMIAYAKGLGFLVDNGGRVQWLSKP